MMTLKQMKTNVDSCVGLADSIGQSGQVNVAALRAALVTLGNRVQFYIGCYETLRPLEKMYETMGEAFCDYYNCRGCGECNASKALIPKAEAIMDKFYDIMVSNAAWGSTFPVFLKNTALRWWIPHSEELANAIMVVNDGYVQKDFSITRDGYYSMSQAIIEVMNMLEGGVKKYGA